jgi:ABC-2 type transport system permease protein
MNHNTFSGLRCLIALEDARWKKSYNWLKSILVWLAIINSLMFLVLVYIPGLTGVTPDVSSALDTLFQMLSGVCPIGAIIVVHNLLISEKENGTAAWVLSAPVSRKSIIISKLSVNLFYTTSIIIILQSMVSYYLIQYATNVSLPITSYYLGIAQIALYLAFWVTLTIMLGVVLDNRGTVIGMSLGIMYLMGPISTIASRYIPFIPKLMPSSLLNSAISSATGGTLSPLANIVVLMWIIIFTVFACLRFEKLEL